MSDSRIVSDQRSRPSRQVTSKSRAVDLLYRRYAPDLLGWLRRKFGEGPPDPQDVVQATFESMMDLPEDKDIKNERAYLYTVAANIAVSGVRSQIRLRSLIERELKNLEAETEKNTPERVYEVKQRLSHLSSAFEKLTDRQKEIVIRSRLYGQTYMEIKEKRGWSLGTIATDMKSAMLELSQIDADEESRFK